MNSRRPCPDQVQKTTDASSPSMASEDRTVRLAPEGDVYSAPVALSPGAWRVEVRTLAGPAFAIVDRLLLQEPR